MKKEINVVGAILIRNQRILCTQRGDTKSLPLKWEFPGGKIEAGESAHSALERELVEELAIKVELEKDTFDQVSYEYDFGIVNLTTIIGNIVEGEPKLTEHIDLAWLTPAELETLDWAPADIPTVQKLSQIILE